MVYFAGSTHDRDAQMQSFGRSFGTFTGDDFSYMETADAFARAAASQPGAFSSVLIDLNSRFLDDSDKISKDQWDNHRFNRSGIDWYNGLREDTAELLARRRDNLDRVAPIIAAAKGAKNIAGYASGLLVGAIDPNNVAAGVAAALTTKGLGATGAFASLKNYSSFVRNAKNIKQIAGTAALEGALAAAYLEPVTRISAETLQEDITFADTLFNFATSTVLSAGFAVAPAMVGKGMAAVGRRARYNVPTPEQSLNDASTLFDVALGDTLEGRHIDLDANMAVRMAHDREDMLAQRRALQDEYSAALTRLDEVGVSDQRIYRALDDIAQQRKYAEYGLNDLRDAFDFDASLDEVYGALKVIEDSDPSKVSPDRSLLSFIRKLGGVKDNNGELAAVGINGRTLPGLLNNVSGRQLDDVALAAYEAGFFPELGDRPDINTLLDKLNDVVNNRQVDGDAVAELNAAERFLDDLGVDSRDIIENKAANIETIRALDAEAETLKSRLSGEDGMQRMRGNIRDIERQLDMMPSEEELVDAAQRAINKDSALYNEGVEIDDDIIAEFGDDIDMALEKDIADRIQELGETPREFRDFDSDMKRTEQTADAILACAVGR